MDFSCGKGGKGHQTNSAVSGKRKKGAKLPMDNSGVARLTDPAGRHWTARACVRGNSWSSTSVSSANRRWRAKTRQARATSPVVMPRAEDVEKLARTAMAPDAYAKRYEANEIRNDAM